MATGKGAAKMGGRVERRRRRREPMEGWWGSMLIARIS